MRVRVAEATANSGGTQQVPRAVPHPGRRRGPGVPHRRGAGPDRRGLRRRGRQPAVPAARRRTARPRRSRPTCSTSSRTSWARCRSTSPTTASSCSPTSRRWSTARPGRAFPYDALSPSRPDQLRIASFNVENFFPEGGDLDGGIVTQAQYEEKQARIVDAIADRLERPGRGRRAGGLRAGDPAGRRRRPRRLHRVPARGQRQPRHRRRVPGQGHRHGVEPAPVGQGRRPRRSRRRARTSPGGLFDRPPLVDRRRARRREGHRVLEPLRVQVGATTRTAASRRPSSCATGSRSSRRPADRRSSPATSTTSRTRARRRRSDGTTTLDPLWDARARAGALLVPVQRPSADARPHVRDATGCSSACSDFNYAHFDNDYYERADPADGHHVSDHDPPVVTLRVAAPPPPPPANLVAPAIVGRVKVNETIGGFPGLWRVERGSLQLTYRWLRCTRRRPARARRSRARPGCCTACRRRTAASYLRFEVTATGRRRRDGRALGARTREVGERPAGCGSSTRPAPFSPRSPEGECCRWSPRRPTARRRPAAAGPRRRDRACARRAAGTRGAR